MTHKMKAGKECPNQAQGRRNKWPEFFCKEDCECCHGIGWIYAPEESLTASEAEKLLKVGKIVQYRYLQGDPNVWEVLGSMQRGPYQSLFAFRLAPAQEEPAAMESVEEMVNRIAKEEIEDRKCQLSARICMRVMAKTLLSLTPTQLEALRKGRAS